MNMLLINIALALAWSAFTGRFEPDNLTLGFGLSYLILWISRRAFKPSTYFIKVPQVIRFILFFLWELLVANLRVARLILSSQRELRPRVIAVPLETCNEIEVTILANLVSLTPGTLSLDISRDRGALYVHAMYAPDPDVIHKDIKVGFERRVLALTRGNGVLEEWKESK